MALLAGLRHRGGPALGRADATTPAWAGVGGPGPAPPATSPTAAPSAWAATAAAWDALSPAEDPLDPASIPWPPPVPPGHLLATVARGSRGKAASLEGAWRAVALLYHPDKLGARLGVAGAASPAGRAALARGAAVMMAAREERRAWRRRAP